MSTARIFQSGNSQAVRLPKEFRFEVDTVEIFRRGDEVVLRPPASIAAGIFDALAKLGGGAVTLWPKDGKTSRHKNARAWNDYPLPA